jgi:hypothetical protein
VFGLKEKDASFVFGFNSGSAYSIREVLAKEEGLEFTANKGGVGVALIYSHQRIVLETGIA